MKKLLLCIAACLASAMSQAAPEIIYNQPEGLLRIYNRQGKTVAEAEETYQVITGEQSGTMSIVYAADNVVYLQDPVSGYTMAGSWVKGTLSDDGKKITVPLGQYVDYTRSFDMAYQLQMLNYNATEDTYEVDETTTEVTYSISDDGVITLNGTSQQHVLGLIFRTFGNPQGASIGQDFMYLNYLWIGLGDYESTFTLMDLQVQQPPSGMSTYIVYATSAEYDGSAYSPYDTIVRMGRDGNDIWVQGISRLLPSAWIKGTVIDDKAVFPTGQFMGTLEGIPLFLHGASLNEANSFDIKDIEMIMEGNDLYTYDFIFVTTSAVSLQYVNFYMGMTLAKDLETTAEPPTGLQADSYLLTHDDGTERVFVALDGNNIYLQGIWGELPDSWIHGTIEGGKVTFAMPQFLGLHDEEDEEYRIYATAFDAQTGVLQRQLTFDYDKASRKMSNPSSPISIGINKTGYLSVLEYYNPQLKPEHADAVSGILKDDKISSPRYDLSGRRVAKTQKGLQIVGRKKVVVR